MKSRHWTDEDFQRHIDGDGALSAGAQTGHPRRCAACRKELNAYRRVAAMLSHPPPMTLPGNFAAGVAARALRSRARTGLFSKEWFWIQLALLFGLGAWIFFYQAPVLETFRPWFTRIFADFQPLWGFWSKGSRYLPWLAEGVGALVLAALLDRAAISFRAKRLQV